MARSLDRGYAPSPMGRGKLESLEEDSEEVTRRSQVGSRSKKRGFSIAEEEDIVREEEEMTPEPDGSIGSEFFEQLRNLQRMALGEKCKRTAMGEYVPPAGKAPLTQLALPTPGPTDYQPKLTITKPAAPQYSIVGKAKKANVEDIPGPSKYNTQKDLVWKDKKMTLKGKGKMTGVKQEGAGWNQSVGAAAYFVTHGNLGTGYAKYTMGLKSRIQNGPPNRLVHPVDTDGFNTPGPAEYQPNSSYWGHGANKKSIGLLLQKKAPRSSPGPAEYNITRDKAHGPLYSFGARLNGTVGNDDGTPGPGSYQIGTTIGKSVAKSISGRQPIKKTDISPSPNTYSLPSSIGKGPKNMMTYRAFETIDSALPGPIHNHTLNFESTPGPNEYSLRKAHMRKGPEFTCRKLCRPTYPDILHHPEHAVAQNPDVGPNTYNPNRGISKNDKPAYSIGTRFKPKIETTPGPTTYDVKQTNRQGSDKAPAFSIGKRIDEDPGKLGPGPATYYPKPITSTATCSISGWNRKTKDNSSKLPAANAYGVESGQTRRGKREGPSVTLKGRPSPYVYSGFKSAVA